MWMVYKIGRWSLELHFSRSAPAKGAFLLFVQLLLFKQFYTSLFKAISGPCCVQLDENDCLGKHPQPLGNWPSVLQPLVQAHNLCF